MEKFKILNGRVSFYQWDFDQKLAVLDDTVTEVHFPLGTERCPPLPVYEHEGQRAVDVPNILLQTAGMKRVYAFVKDDLGGRTICTEVFRVNEKPKPDDYVYTEVEVWTAEKAVQKALQEAKDSGDFTGPPGPKGDPGVVKFVVVNELPETDTENAIYLVPVADGAEDNLFDEYIFVDGAWEKIGSAAVAVDMTGYVKNTDYAAVGVYGLVKTKSSTDDGIYLQNGNMAISEATSNNIDTRKTRRPIVPTNLDYAVKVGLTTNTIALTDEEEAAACSWLGAVEKMGAGNGWRVYGVYADGTPWEVPIVNAATVATLPWRGVGGTVIVGEPTADNHATTKAYVDGLVGDIKTTLDSIIAIQESLIGGKETAETEEMEAMENGI